MNFIIDFNYLVKLEGFCQGFLILWNFWSEFLKKIGWFKILEIAVSPACPPKLYATVGATSKGQTVTRIRPGTTLVYTLNTNEFRVLQNLHMLAKVVGRTKFNFIEDYIWQL